MIDDAGYPGIANHACARALDYLPNHSTTPKYRLLWNDLTPSIVVPMRLRKMNAPSPLMVRRRDCCYRTKKVAREAEQYVSERETIVTRQPQINAYIYPTPSLSPPPTHTRARHIEEGRSLSCCSLAFSVYQRFMRGWEREAWSVCRPARDAASREGGGPGRPSSDRDWWNFPAMCMYLHT